MIRALLQYIPRLGQRSMLPKPLLGSPYDRVEHDFSYESVLGDREDFLAWSAAPRNYFRERVVNVPPAKLELRKTARRTYDRVEVESYHFDIVDHSGASLDCNYVADVAHPTRGNGREPIVLIHGHGLVGGESRGSIPIDFYTKPDFYHGHAHRLIERGQAFVVLPNVIHRPFTEIAGQHDYSVIWASLAYQALGVLRGSGRLPAKSPLLGIAAGGHTAMTLAAVDDGIASVGAHGAFFPLDLCRRDYRLDHHPDCFEFRAFASYTPIFALTAPRPLWVGIGRGDALSLNLKGVTPAAGFSGLKRGATGDELLGAGLLLREIWSKFGACVELCVHDGGHEEFDIGRYMSWLEASGAASGDTQTATT